MGGVGCISTEPRELSNAIAQKFLEILPELFTDSLRSLTTRLSGSKYPLQLHQQFLTVRSNRIVRLRVGWTEHL
jgi:hypothetical protein